MKRIRYNLLSFISFLISFLGYLGIKLTIVLVSIWFGLFSEKFIGNLGLPMGWILGLFVGGLLFMGLQRLNPYFEKFYYKIQTYKTYVYTELYGRNYPKPILEEFGINYEELKEYNNRFQFEYIKIIFTYGFWVAACIYLLQANHESTLVIYLFGGVLAVAILINYLFDYWNRSISQRHRYYKKINAYLEALNIYNKIQNENNSG